MDWHDRSGFPDPERATLLRRRILDLVGWVAELDEELESKRREKAKAERDIAVARRELEMLERGEVQGELF